MMSFDEAPSEVKQKAKKMMEDLKMFLMEHDLDPSEVISDLQSMEDSESEESEEMEDEEEGPSQKAKIALLLLKKRKE